MKPAAVFDCNVYLQILLSRTGAAHACWDHVLAGRLKLYFSLYVVEEILRLPANRKLRRLGNLTYAQAEAFAEQLNVAATLVEEVPATFELPRDPADSHYVNLAVVTGSFLIASNDKDLLSLMNDSNPTGVALRQAHPSFQVLTPRELLATIRA